MDWIVKIDGEENKNKRIRIKFKPIRENIVFQGEFKTKDGWEIFSYIIHDNIEISLEEIQEKMEIIISEMNKRIKEYENLNKGFSVLKLIALKEDDE